MGLQLQSSVIIKEVMDAKMHRYMQRIEKIINTPKKAANNASPIRPAKSPLKHKPNQLDRYIKYELSMKVIGNIISRNNTHLVMLFFNMLRNSDYRQKEKIYKFVAIERQDVRVDLGIAAKLLTAVVKQLAKKRFAHFLMQLQNRRPSQFTFKKHLKDEPFAQIELLRANSQNNPSNYKASSVWVQDMEAENQRLSALKHINDFKAFTAKVIAKYVNQSSNKLLRKGFQAVKLQLIEHRTLKNDQSVNKTIQSQLKTWEEKQKNYLSEIQQLSEKLSKCQLLLLKQSTSKANENTKLKSAEIPKNLKLDNCFDNFLCFVNRKLDKDKFRLLQQIGTIFHLAASNSKKNKKHVKNDNYLKGALQIYQFATKPSKLFLQKLKQTKGRSQKNASCLVIPLLEVMSKRKMQYFGCFFRQLAREKTVKQDLLHLNYDVQQRSNSSRNNRSHLDNKSNFKMSAFSNSDTVTPLAKPNFHLFVDRVFKFIVVIGKLLAPLRQGFDRINQYALYSYEIEQKFKVVALKNVRQSFNRLASKPKKDERKLLSKLLVLQAVVRERLVQSFSHIKIKAKQSELKIKLFPVKLHIVEATKQFIEQRKMYSMHSLDNWSKLRQHLLESVQSGSSAQKRK